MKRRPLFRVILFLAILTIPYLVSAQIDTIEYPANNEIITQSQNIKLNITSTAGSNCYFNYNHVRNVSVDCEGVTLINLPSGNGVYNLTVGDDDNSITHVVTVRRPSGDIFLIVYVLTLIVILLLIFYLILLLAKLAMFTIGLYDVAISLGLYFTLLYLYQLAIEYMTITYFLDWLQLFIQILAWPTFILPLIGFVVCFIVRAFQKKGKLTVEDYNGKVF